jgi:solute:Na+ symporter, SSS family
MGGLRAVVITDVIQTAIPFGAAIVTVITISISLGGMHAWWPEQWPAHWAPLKFGWNLNDRLPFLVLFLSIITWYISTSASDQIAIQRYLSTRDAKAARSALIVSLLADTCVALILACVGLALMAYFRAFPHLLPDGQPMMADGDKLFPQFIIVGLPTGISGLVVARLLACAMSALSAGINSTCSVLTVDIIDRLRGARRKAGSGAERVGQLKHVSILIGVIVVLLSMFVDVVQGNLVEVGNKVVNLLTAPLAGLFLLAMFVPWARTFGALVGVASGLIVAIAISSWKEITGTQGISFMSSMPAALLIEVAIGSLVSLLPICVRRAPLQKTLLSGQETSHE